MSAGGVSPLFPKAFMGDSLPVRSGESILGGTLQLTTQISSQTARCYTIVKHDRQALVGMDAQSVARDVKSPPPPPPLMPAARQSSPLLDEGNINSTSSSVGGGNSPENALPATTPPSWLWLVATTTDLLLLAVCVLMNIPAVARLLTSYASHLDAESETHGLLPSPDNESVGIAQMLERRGQPLEWGFRGAVEYTSRVLGMILVFAPQHTVDRLEKLSALLFGWATPQQHDQQSDSVVSASATSLASLWSTSIAPSLKTPALFWTVVLLVFVAARLWWRSKRVYTEEVVVVRGLGLQVSVRDYAGRSIRTKFIDANRIRSVFIHEAFFRQSVVFYLAVLIDNEAQVTVLFEEMMPRLAMLKPLLCGIRHVLFAEPEDGPTLRDLEERITSGGSADVSE